MVRINAISNVAFGATLKTHGLSRDKREIIDNQIKARFEEITAKEYPNDVLELYTEKGKLKFWAEPQGERFREEVSGTFSTRGANKLLKLSKEEIAEELMTLLAATHKANANTEKGSRILGSLESFLGDSSHYSMGDEIEDAYGLFWQAFHQKSADEIEDELAKDPVLKTIRISQ